MKICQKKVSIILQVVQQYLTIPPGGLSIDGGRGSGCGGGNYQKKRERMDSLFFLNIYLLQILTRKNVFNKIWGKYV